MTPMAVAIVSFNAGPHLDACLASVRPEAPSQTLVVDNGSTDGSIELVRSRFPEVQLEVAAANRGYGTAANRALARCAAPYVLLLNGDTVLAPGALEALARYLDAHPRAAIVGPRLRNADGSLQASCHPFLGTFQSFLEKTALARLLARIPAVRDRYLLVNSAHARARVVPWVLGAALAIRRSAFEAVGGFDESFFLYAEEVDLCYRLKTAGWEIHFAPVTDVIHVGGVSTQPYGGGMIAQRVESAIRFYDRHYPPARRARLVALIKVAAAARWLRDGIRLRATGDAARRARLAASVIAWRRILLGDRRDQFGAPPPA
jgi:N-acetylglucosaminyl-diphospho-decaprenol L-rhamnosyltransferase